MNPSLQRAVQRLRFLVFVVVLIIVPGHGIAKGAFASQTDQEKTASQRLYGSSGGNGRPVDLGYWMGYKISEAYFKKASDKKQAVRDMLLIKNCKEFLNASGYAEKFGANTQ